MSSNVGTAAVYEAGDQRTRSDAEIEEEKKENRFHEGKENSHKANDSSMSPPACALLRHECVLSYCCSNDHKPQLCIMNPG